MEKLDKERYLKRVIVVCWIALAICFGIKLFGGNLFEIMCENENFIKVCEYADNHFWANYILYLPYSFVSLYFFTLSVMQKTSYTKSQLIILIITVSLGVFVKLISSVLGFIFDIWQMIIMPAIFTIKSPPKHLWIIPANILLMAFQLISMFVKNVEIGILTNKGVLISMIFSIDVLLMLIIYFGYMNTKNIKKGE
jgi:hypothetical protein